MRRLTPLLAVLLLAGCGGARHTDAAADWRARADGICLDAREQIGTVSPHSSFAGLARAATQAELAGSRAIIRLASSAPPASVSRTADAVVTALRSELPLLRAVVTGARTHDAAAIAAAASRGRAAETRVRAAARAAGLQSCGAGALTPGG